MRQAAANGIAATAARRRSQALDELREAQQRLERNQGGRGERDLQRRAATGAKSSPASRRRSRSDVNGLDQAQAGAARDAKAQALAERKEAMDAKVADLQ